MKKVATCILGLFAGLFLAVVIFYISIVIQNDNYAARLEKDILEVPLPEKTECVDSISRAGKLVGNGNGMQYFGAILLKSELSLEEITEYYKEHHHGDDFCTVEKQEGHSIDALDGFFSFKVQMSADAQYYIVYSWGNKVIKFGDLDIRGH